MKFRKITDPREAHEIFGTRDKVLYFRVPPDNTTNLRIDPREEGPEIVQLNFTFSVRDYFTGWQGDYCIIDPAEELLPVLELGPNPNDRWVIKQEFRDENKLQPYFVDTLRAEPDDYNMTIYELLVQHSAYTKMEKNAIIGIVARVLVHSLVACPSWEEWQLDILNGDGICKALRDAGF